jgi:hypothetical protein
MSTLAETACTPHRDWSSWIKSSITTAERRDATAFYARMADGPLLYLLLLPLTLFALKGIGALVRRTPGFSVSTALMVVWGYVHLAWQLGKIPAWVMTRWAPIWLARGLGGVAARGTGLMVPLASRSMDDQGKACLALALFNAIAGTAAFQTALDALFSGDSASGRVVPIGRAAASRAAPATIALTQARPVVPPEASASAKPRAGAASRDVDVEE